MQCTVTPESLIERGGGEGRTREERKREEGGEKPGGGEGKRLSVS